MMDTMKGVHNQINPSSHRVQEAQLNPRFLGGSQLHANPYHFAKDPSIPVQNPNSNGPPPRSGVVFPSNRLASIPRSVQIPPQMLQQQQNMLQGPYEEGPHHASDLLLPPEHFTSPGISHDFALPPNGFQGAGEPAPLMNLNIPSSNFMKTLNFEALSYGSNKATGSTGGEQGFYPQAQRLIPQEAPDEMESQFTEDGEYQEESMLSENNADIMEHQQAKAQAQLLDRFKQLREWQVSQQETLMRQQHEQLSMLKHEQSRVQQMIVKQRETQWGGLPPRAPKTSSTSPPRSSQNKPPKHPNSTLPHAIAQGTLALARMNRPEALGIDAEAIPRPSTPVQVVKGRPVPNIVSGPSTPLEYLEHGNPNLDSETNTLASGTPLEDGIARLADTASETSEQPDQKGPSYFQSTSGGDRPTAVEVPGYGLNSASNTRFGSPIPFSMHDVSRGSVRSDSSSQHAMQSQGNPHSGNFALPSQMLPRHAHPGFLRNGPQNNLQQHTNGVPFANTAFMDPHIVGHVPFRPGVHVPLPDGQVQQNKVLDFREHADGERLDDDADYYEDEESEGIAQEQEEDEVEESLQEDGDTNEVEETLELDDMPVEGTKKSFEQLLEEELRREEERLKTESTQPENTVPSNFKKAFLKRGDGTARFGLRGKKPAPKLKTSTATRMETELKTAKSESSKPKPTEISTGVKKTSTAQKASNHKKPQVHVKASGPVKNSPPNKLTLKPPPARKSVSPPSKQGQSEPARPVPVKKLVQSAKKQVPVSKSRPRNGSREAVAPRDSTGEMSFQQVMHQRAQHEEEETEELEEFEILEQYADDNASFLSNMSAVDRALEKEKVSKQPDSDPNIFRQNRQNSNPIMSTPIEEEEDRSDSESSSADDGEETSQDDTMENNDAEVNGRFVRNTHQVTNQTEGTMRPQDPADSLRTIHRKVASLGGHSPDKLSGTEQLRRVRHFSESDNEETNDHNHDHNRNIYKMGRGPEEPCKRDSSTDDESESESEEELDIKGIILSSKFNGQSKPASTAVAKHSPEKQNLHDNIRSQVTEEEGTESAERNTQNNNVNSGATSHNSAVSSQGNMDRVPGNNAPQMEFGDEEEWEDEAGEPENSDFRQSSATKPSGGPVTKTKVFADWKTGDDTDQGTSSTPPTSKLVTKLFPKLRTEKPKVQPTEQQQEQQLCDARQAALGDGIQSRALRDKLAELENEISRFRRENATLENLRKEREEGLSHIKKEMSEFEKQKADEIQRLQDFKTEETRKLKKEKRLFEQYQKASRTMPDRKEREETENLKKQLSDLQDELKRKEQRWTASSSRLRDRIEHLEQENVELKDEVKVLEKKRLEVWQQKEALTITSKKEDKRLSMVPAQPPAAIASRVPQPQASSAVSLGPQPKGLDLAQRDNILRLSGTTDGDNDSDLPDSASQSAGVLYKSESKDMMQATSQTVSRIPNKRHSSSPKSPLDSHPQGPPTSLLQSSSQSSIPRKMAVAANITSIIDKGDEKYEEMQHADGKIERIYTNGAREILFSNGTRKQVSEDGQSIIVSFFNGDIKQILPDQRVVYFYADAQTTHTTYPDGLEIIQFPNGQSEKHYPDGTREITFPDQIIKYLFPSGVEESIFPDGTVIRVEKNGDKVMEFPNGQREIHTPHYKRREYPDGTVKTVYPDGRQETRYSSGRIRVKDKDGQIIVDQRV